MKEKRYAGAGKFVWHELLTGDVDGAVDFYGRLFGWTFLDVEREGSEPYKTISVAGENIGGIVPLGSSGGQPSYWLPYITVEDVSTGFDDAEKLNGEGIFPPTDIPGFGRYAVVKDPGGAMVSLFSGGDPSEEQYEGPPRPGTFIWNDVITRNPAKDGEFYCGVFGWQLYEVDMGPQGLYHLLRRGEINEGGMIHKPEEAKGPSSWLPYVAVEDIQAACVQAVHAGGNLYVPPSDLHGAGLYAVTGDPGGALFALFQPSATLARGSADGAE